MMTLEQAMNSNVVGEMIPIHADSLPDHIRRDYLRCTARFWEECYMPVDGCRYGCKVYWRRQGAVVRYAVSHSRTYGHR